MSNFNFNFKVGDKVYYPKASNEVLTLAEHTSLRYPLMINFGGGDIRSITHNGKFHCRDLNSSTFPATQEWYEKLSHVYPNLEKPPGRKDPKEVIEAMLASGAILIPCLVVDHDDNRILDYKKVTRHSPSVLIYGISENGRFLSTNPHCSSYKYAVPFDIKTRKVIVDYIDGIEVLED